MIIKTMVAVRKNGIVGTKWVDYLDRKSKSKKCTAVYRVVQGHLNTDMAILLYHNRWLETGIARHTIFSTLKHHNPKEMLLLAHTVITQFNVMTGRNNIITLYSAHYDTPFPHVHVLQSSNNSSQIYINKQELNYIYAISSFVFKEPIGAKAYLRLFNDKIAHAKSTEEQRKTSAYEKETVRRIKMMRDSIKQEVKTMEEHTII